MGIIISDDNARAKRWSPSSCARGKTFVFVLHFVCEGARTRSVHSVHCRRPRNALVICASAVNISVVATWKKRARIHRVQTYRRNTKAFEKHFVRSRVSRHLYLSVIWVSFSYPNDILDVFWTEINCFRVVWGGNRWRRGCYFIAEHNKTQYTGCSAAFIQTNRFYYFFFFTFF